MAAGLEDENADFYFITRRKLSLGQEVAEVPQSQSLLCVSNKYGVAFAGVNQGVLAFKTCDLHRVNADTSFTKINDIAPPDKLGPKVLAKMPNPPQHLALSANQQVLSVVARDAAGQLTLYFYKIQHFFGGGSVFYFASGGVSSKDTVQVVDLCWNPSPDSMVFAFVVESGSVTIIELRGNKMERIASARSIGATAISWSPKGKQLAVGLRDGSVRQYSLSCEVKKDHPVPAGVFTEAVEVKGLYWVSTFTFLVVYCPTGSGSGGLPPLSAVILNVPKTGDPSAINFDDIFYGIGLGRQQFYFSFLQPWNIILAASSVSNEIAVLAKDSDSETKWTHWFQVDTGRAETPLTADQEETYPRGMALDLTCMEDIAIGKGDEAKKYPPAPVAMVITNKGVLCPFTAMNLASPLPPNGQPFVAPPQDISLSGEPAVAPQVVDITRTSLPLNIPMPQVGTTSTAAQPLAVQVGAPQGTGGMPFLSGTSAASQPPPFTLQTPLTSHVLGGQGAALPSLLGLPSVPLSSGGAPSIPVQAPSGSSTQASFLGLSSMVPPSSSSLGQHGLQTAGVFTLPGLPSVTTSVVAATAQPSLVSSASTSAFTLGSTSLLKTGSTPSLQSSGSLFPSQPFRSSAPTPSLGSTTTSLTLAGPSLSATPTVLPTLGGTPLWLSGTTASSKLLGSGAPPSQPLGSGGPLSQPLGGPLSQPLSGPLGQPLSGPLGQPLGGPLNQPLGGPLSQPLGGPLGQPLGGPVGQPLGDPVGQPLGGPLSQPLGGPLSQPLGGPLSQPLGGPVGQPLGGPVSQPLGGPLSQSLGGPLSQPLSGPLSQPLGGPLSQPLSGPVGQPLGGPVGQPLGGPLSQPFGGPLSQPLGGPVGQPLGGPLSQPLGTVPPTKGGVPANLLPSSVSSLSPAPTSSIPSSVLTSSFPPPSAPQQPPLYTGPVPPVQPTVTVPYSSLSGSALGSVPLTALGKMRAAPAPVSSAGASPSQPTQASPSAIAALTSMGVLSQLPVSTVGQNPSAPSTLPAAPIGASYRPVGAATVAPPGAVPPSSAVPTALLKPSVLSHSDAAPPTGQHPASDTPATTSMTKMAATGVHTGAPQVVAVQSKQNLDDKYSGEIKKLVETFADSLNDIRERAETILGVGCFDENGEQSDPAIGTVKERLELTQDLTEMCSQMEEMEDNLQSLKYHISDCKSQSLNSFAHLEECKSMLNRRRDPRLTEYNSRRPLDRVLKGKRDDLLSRYSKLRVTIHELDSQVEDELNRQAGRQLRQAGSGRTLPLPSTQVLYNTLATHRKITMMQSKELDQLQKKMEKCGLTTAWHLPQKKSLARPQKSRFPKSSPSPRSRYSLDPSLQFVSTLDSEEGASGSYSPGWRVMDERVQEVTDFLMNIQVTPVKRCPVKTLVKRSSNGNGREADRSPEVEEAYEGEGSLEDVREKEETNLAVSKVKKTINEPLTHSLSGEYNEEEPLPGITHSQVVGSANGAVTISDRPTATEPLATPRVNLSTDPVKLSYHQLMSVRPSTVSYLSEGQHPLQSHGAYSPPSGRQPPSGGAYPPPSGPQPPSGGAYPPPSGPQPPSGGAYPPPSGRQPPPSGPQPPSGGAYPPPSGRLPGGAYPPPSGPQPPSVGAYPHPSGPQPPSGGAYPPPSGRQPPPSGPQPPSVGAYPPPSGPQPPSVGAYPPPSGPQPPSGGAYPPPSGPLPGGAYPPPSGPYPPPSGQQPPPSGAYPPPTGPYPPPSGPQPPPSGAYPPPSGPYPSPSGPQPPPSGPQPPPSGAYPSPSGPQPPSGGAYPSPSGPQPPPSGPQPPPSGAYPPPSGPQPPPSGAYPSPSGLYPPPSGPQPPPSGLRTTPPLGPRQPQTSGLYPPGDMPLLTGPNQSGTSTLPALAQDSKLGKTLALGTSSAVTPPLVAWSDTQKGMHSAGREGLSGIPSSTVYAPLTSLQYTVGGSAHPMSNIFSSAQAPSLLTAPVAEQHTSTATQPFSLLPPAQGKDGGGSQPSMPLGLRPPFTVPHGPPPTSVVSTQPQSVATATLTEVGVKSYALGRQQEGDGLATASSKDTESHSQGTDIGSTSDLSQEDQALGESQSSVLSYTADIPSLARQPPFPSITLTPGTPSKTPASQIGEADNKPPLGPSEDTLQSTQQTATSSVPSSQPSTSTGPTVSLLGSKPLFGSHLQAAPGGSKSPQFVTTPPVLSGDGRKSPFEQSLHDHGRTSSAGLAQPGEGIQFKTSMHSQDAFLTGDTGGAKETAKEEDTKEGWAANLPPPPALRKDAAERGCSTADTSSRAPAGAIAKEPTSTTATVPSVTASLGSSKDAEAPSMFGASTLPPLQLKGMPLSVQPGASGAAEKASVISLGPTSTTSSSALPVSLADVGAGGGGGDEEAMEETGDARDGGGGDGLFGNMSFMSGLGLSAPQTLPTSSAAGSSLMGGGLFGGFGSSTAPTESTGSLIQPGRLASSGGVSSAATGIFPNASASTASAASWWSAVSSPSSSVKLGFGHSLGRMGSSPSLPGQTASSQSPLLTGTANTQSASAVPQTGVFAQYAGVDPLAQLRQAGSNPFGWMQQQQQSPVVPLGGGGGGGGGTTPAFQGSSFTQYRS